jgi:hypothetical protein
MLTMLVLLPLLLSAEASPFWLSAILTIIMITGPLSIATDPVSFSIALVLGLITALNSWLGDVLPDSSAYRIVGQLATVSIFLLLSVQIFRYYLFSRRPIDTDTLIAAVNAYVCIGIMYAFAYRFLSLYDPSAFTFNFGDDVDFNVFVYLSFVTQTTLGYGDISPTTDAGRILAWSQALLGQLFIALTIARIVGAMVAKETS